MSRLIIRACAFKNFFKERCSRAFHFQYSGTEIQPYLGQKERGSVDHSTTPYELLGLCFEVCNTINRLICLL